MSMLSLHISLDSIDSMHRNVMPALAISCRAHTHTNINVAIYITQYEYSVHCTIMEMQGK